MFDPKAAAMLGQPKEIEPIFIKDSNGRVAFVHRVCTTMMGNDIIASIVTQTAIAVTGELLGVLEDTGVIPKGSLATYTKAIQEKQQAQAQMQGEPPSDTE